VTERSASPTLVVGHANALAMPAHTFFFACRMSDADIPAETRRGVSWYDVMPLTFSNERAMADTTFSGTPT
jgi:hypothetical protein